MLTEERRKWVIFFLTKSQNLFTNKIIIQMCNMSDNFPIQTNIIEWVLYESFFP